MDWSAISGSGLNTHHKESLDSIDSRYTIDKYHPSNVHLQMQTTMTRGAPGMGEGSPVCPRCGGRAVVSIGYGFPRREEDVWGGFYVGHGSPAWHCLSCLHEFGQVDQVYW